MWWPVGDEDVHDVAPADVAADDGGGSGVKQIQTALTAHGDKVAADGTFGAQTEATHLCAEGLRHRGEADRRCSADGRAGDDAPAGAAGPTRL
jgi:hypothetical protein